MTTGLAHEDDEPPAGAPDPPRSKGARRAWMSVALAIFMAAIQAALLTSTAFDKSDTIDEPVYLSLAWRHFHGELSCAPGLPLWAFAAAQRAVDPAFVSPPSTPLADRGRHSRLSALTDREYRRDLVAARGTTIVAVVAGGLFLWSIARRFGDRVAALTHALWCASPLVLAHGALAGLDGWVAAAMCLVLWAAGRSIERPTGLRAAITGGALALAASAKVTAVIAAPVMIALAVWSTRDARGKLSPARALALSGYGLLGFALVTWVLYKLRFAPIGMDDLGAHVGSTWLGPRVPVPAPEWVECLVVQLDHGYADGHPSYLAGETSNRGWWWFYLASLALQTTIAAQALFAFRIGAAILRRPSRSALLVDAALLAFPLLLLVVMSAARTQNGIRYLLPAWPFAALLGGRALLDVDRLPSARSRRLAIAGIGAALALGVASVLRVHPHQLMYFNAWAGGPEGGPRYLVHGSDWGQDARRLGEWQREHAVPTVFYLPYSMMKKRWGIESVVPPCRPEVGVYALHAVHLYRAPPAYKGCFDWLAREPPDERLGYSIYIYRVDQARLDRLTRTPSPSAGRP